MEMNYGNVMEMEKNIEMNYRNVIKMEIIWKWIMKMLWKWKL